MTKEELKHKAEEYSDSVEGYDVKTYSISDIEQAYIAGATENGIQWHDLRKNPNDLPKEDKKYFVYTNLGNYYFTRFRKTYWIGVTTNEFVSNNAVIAWCEIPQFKE